MNDAQCWIHGIVHRNGGSHFREVFDILQGFIIIIRYE